MKVALYSFSGCPSYKIALDHLKQALRLENLSDEVEMISIADVNEAQAARLIGSPTIRIDGIDIEGAKAEAGAYGFGCRVYRDGDQAAGWPSVRQLRSALKRARRA